MNAAIAPVPSTSDTRQPRALRRLFVVFTLLLVGAYLISLVQTWQDTLRDTRASLTHINSMLVQDFRSTMKTHELLLLGVGSELIAQGALQQPENGRKLLERMIAIEPGIAGLGLALPDGQLILVSHAKSGQPLPNLAERPETRDSFSLSIEKNSIQVGRPYFMPALDQWVSPVRVPIHDSTGKIIAVMTAGYSLKTGSANWASMTLPPEVETALLRQDGYLQNIFPMPADTLENIYGRPVAPETIRQAGAITDTSGFTSIFLPRRDGNFYVAYERIAEHGLLANTFMPRQAVVTHWLKRMITPTALLFFYLLGSFLAYRHAIREQQKAESEITNLTSWQKAVLDGADYSIISTDIHGTIVSFNAAAQRMLGYSLEEVIGRRNPGIFHDPDEVALHASELTVELGRTITPGFEVFVAKAMLGTPEEREWTYIRKDGSRFAARLSVTPLHGVNGEITGFMGIAADLTEGKQAQIKLEYLARHDSLTGLLNRHAMHEQVKHSLDQCKPASHPALMLIDLDRFKEINDTLGHHVGDRILQGIGPLLSQAIGDYPALIGRLGGDEFTIFLSDAGDLNNLKNIAGAVLQAIKQPIEIDGMRLEIDASIGVALFPLDGDDSHTLLRSADVAMYEAKSRGGGIAFYDANTDRHSPERLAIMADLGNAVRENQLFLHYQPQYDVHKQQITGFEALVRWHHPKLGLLYPDRFIPFAEVSEVIHPLTLSVLRQALQQQQAWKKEGNEFTVSVNLSARNLIDDHFVEQIHELLLEFGTQPGELELEVTETALMHDPEGAARRLERIAALGVKLAIDDFGTGYSSLGYLHRLPFHELKIDRLFIKDMLKNEQDINIVRSTILLAHNLGLQVVAEGVESGEIQTLLEQLGCDLIQGYHLSRPKTWEEISVWLLTQQGQISSKAQRRYAAWKRAIVFPA